MWSFIKAFKETHTAPNKTLKKHTLKIDFLDLRIIFDTETSYKIQFHEIEDCWHHMVNHSDLVFCLFIFLMCCLSAKTSQKSSYLLYAVDLKYIQYILKNKHKNKLLFLILHCTAHLKLYTICTIQSIILYIIFLTGKTWILGKMERMGNEVSCDYTL